MISFANPWGLLALLAVPAILVIHLYQRRYPPLLVAGLHLWSVETRQQQAGRTRERLPITPSLLLELLAALLLSLALAGPRFGELDRVTHLVVVLDHSASMQGRGAGTERHRDRAIAELSRRAKSLSRGSVYTVILTGERPTLIAGPLADWSTTEAALRSWQPVAHRHRFEPAWDTALSQAGELGQVLFLTDRLPEPSARQNPRIEVVAVGEPSENVAFSANRWTFDPVRGEGRIYLRVQHLGTLPAAPRVRLVAGEKTLAEQSLELRPGESKGLEFTVPGGLRQVTAQLASEGDGLAIDDRLELIEPKVRTVTVALTLPEGEPQRLLTQVVRSLPDVQLGDVATAHLVIGPASRPPESMSPQWWLGIGPLSDEQAKRDAAVDLAGPFILEKRHPLLDGVVLGGVIWGGVQKWPYDVQPLVSSAKHILVGRLAGTRVPAYVLNLDLERSNIGASPDWPILLTNLVELRRSELAGLQRWSYRMGEEIRFRLFDGESDPHPDRPLRLVYGDRVRNLVRGTHVELASPTEPGVYLVRDGDQEYDRFAVQFQDVEESNLLRLETERSAAAGGTEGQRIAVDAPYSWILAVAILLILAVILADWYVLKPGAQPGRMVEARP